MSNQKENPQEDKIFSQVNAPAPAISADMLVQMLLETQKQLAESQRELAASIRESRIPYVDPNVLKQKEMDNAERRAMVESTARQKAATKKVCPHTRFNGTSNIKWHEHSNGITLGVCGTCFSVFDTRDQADLQILRGDLKSQQSMGRAGSHARRGAVIS